MMKITIYDYVLTFIIWIYGKYFKFNTLIAEKNKLFRFRLLQLSKLADEPCERSVSWLCYRSFVNLANVANHACVTVR